jgi:cyclohexadieny/prephenate dehydrogenase
MGAQARFERVAVLGLGLLGGSLAGALRRRGIAGRVAGATRSGEARASALRRGLVDEVGSPREAVVGADLVVLATPVFAMPPLLREVAGSLREGALVTDVGSVKGLLAETLPGLLPEGVCYVGSHPMAGSHERGLEHARDDLFEGAACIVSEGGDAAAVERVCGLWRALGARVVRRPANLHDAEVAWMSHVPHVLAFAFAEALAGAPAGAAEVAGAGFRDFTRIAQSSPELWGDILTANRKACAAPLQAVATALAELTRAIESNDAEAVERWIAAARETLRRQAPSGAARTSIPVGPEGRPERRTNGCA